MNDRFKAALLGGLMLGVSASALASLSDVAQSLNDGHYRDALEQLQGVSDAERESLRGQLLQAAALAGSGQADKAEERYQALIRQAPGQPEAYNNLAVLYARQGRLKAARDLLEEAMRTHASYATVYDNLSDIYLEMSRSAYAKALQLEKQEKSATLQPLYQLQESASPAVVALADAQLEQPAPPVTAVESQVEAAPPSLSVAEQQQGEESATELAAENVPEVGAELVAPVAPVSPSGSATAAPEVNPAEAVQSALRRWASSWAGQDVNGYLSAYDESFTPGRGLSLEQWQAQRRRRLGKPEYIEVHLSDFEVQLRDSDSAVVDVVQRYTSNRYSDRTRKRFRLIKRPGGWKITSEKTIEVL